MTDTGSTTSDRVAMTRSATLWLKLAMVASVVLPLLLLAVTAVIDYQRVTHQATEHVRKTASIAQEHALKVLETSELILSRVLDLLGDDSDGAIRAREPELHAKLGRIENDIEQVQNIYAWAANGAPLVSSRFYPLRAVNIADREDFRAHLGQRVGTYVTAPLTGRTTGERFFNISRRRDWPDGSFAGVVTVSLRPSYFADFYRQLAAPGDKMAVSLWRADRTLLARYPDQPESLQLGPESALARFIASGQDALETRAISHVDGMDRMFAFRKVGGYPVYMAIALDHRAILDEWYHDFAISALFAVPGALGLLLVTWLALKRTRREHAAIAQWREEAERRTSAEEALRQAQKLEAVGQLTGGVAHDFNNLLQVISTNLYILKLKLRGGEGDAQLAAMTRAVSSGETLTKHLLAFSRRRPLQPRAIRLEDFMDEIQTLIRHTLRGDTALHCTVETGLWPVKADPEELQMALLNIAVNARDAMPEGGTVTLTARNRSMTRGESGVELEGDFVAIAVEDSGHGIPSDVLPRVFEPFFTTKAVGRGTGLGLSQVYGFAIQSDGAATIVSEVGRGTTVTMYLPRAAEAAPAAAPARETEHGVTGSGRVLLVEDNVEIGNAVSDVLREMGYAVRHVVNADEAFALLQQDAGFDLLITDIVMPGSMSGLDLARTVGRHHPGLPVLLMSGYSTEAAKAAAEGYRILGKPFRPEALSEAIRRLRRPRHERDSRLEA